MESKSNHSGTEQKQSTVPPIQTFFDVDRCGYCYLLRVKFSLNKKNELIETIIQVTHLGKLTWQDYIPEYSKYVIWQRAFESYDIFKLGAL